MGLSLPLPLPLSLPLPLPLPCRHCLKPNSSSNVNKKKLKLKLEELFSASSFGVCLYIKSNLHKILDNFYLNGFHIEETTSYDNTYSIWYHYIKLGEII